MLCCGYTLTDFPISIRLTSLALWQSNDCPSASKATLMNMDKYFMWIHYERLHNHNKAKHNKTVCIFLGIYCMLINWVDVGSGNGQPPIREWALASPCGPRYELAETPLALAKPLSAWSTVDLFVNSIGTLATKVSEIWIKIPNVSIKKNVFWKCRL